MNEDSILPSGTQRRSDVRVRARLLVELSPKVVSLALSREAKNGAAAISSETVTISGGGFAFLHDHAIPVGASFNVRLRLPDLPHPLTMRAKVVRCSVVEGNRDNPVFELGLTYTRIAEAARSHIVSYVFRLQRATMANKSNYVRQEDAMSQVIPKEFLDLFQQPAFANLATIMSDGSPQVTPVWCDYDGRYVIINTAKGRVKDRNMRRSPQVALSIMDPKNPYRYLEIRGTVAEITEAGADGHIDKMAKKYMNVDKYPYRSPGEVRVLYKIAPERVSSMG
jgi:PPOX class probable F420-dependent enzyme